MAFIKRFWPWFALVILSIFSFLPLFTPGFFPIHDNTQVQRVFEMTKSLKMGMFPVRWVPDLGYGYGYPIFNFYAPLSYYFGSLFVLLGFDPLFSTKLMMGVGISLAGLFMYIFSKEIWGEFGGLVSAVFYLYAPYHALDIYVRGDVSEFWAYSFIPLVFYALLKIYKEGKLKFVLIGILGFAGIILSHNLTAMLTAPLFLVFSVLLIFFSNDKTKIFSKFLPVFIFGILISAFYWLPALAEMKNTNVSSLTGGGSDFRNHFVCLNQLWDSPWGFGGSAPGCVDGISFKLGKIQVILAGVAFVLTILGLTLKTKTKQIMKRNMIALISIVGLFFSIFLTLEISKPAWEIIPAMAFLQYPWRFLALAAFFASLLSGFVVWFISQYLNKKILTIFSMFLFIGLLFVTNLKLFKPQIIIPKTAVDFTSIELLRWDTSRISDEYLPKNIKKPKTLQEALSDKQIFSFKETYIEKTADMISLAGILLIIISSIFSRKKAKYA